MDNVRELHPTNSKAVDWEQRLANGLYALNNLIHLMREEDQIKLIEARDAIFADLQLIDPAKWTD